MDIYHITSSTLLHANPSAEELRKEQRRAGGGGERCRSVRHRGTAGLLQRPSTKHIVGTLWSDLTCLRTGERETQQSRCMLRTDYQQPGGGLT